MAKGKWYGMTILKADGSRVDVPAQKKEFSLEEKQKAVGGYIETLGFFSTFEGKRVTAYANEEGLLHGLPFNRQATSLWRAQFSKRGGNPQDIGVVGDVAIFYRVDNPEVTK